jgi:DNA-binding transcriptional MerR regulator
VAKSPQAFRTISEIAGELDVPQHVLRFWEAKFTQIRPLRRGGGRRYYRPEDVDLIRGIRRLLYNEGYTIKGVQKVLREQGVRVVADSGREGEPADATEARQREQLELDGVSAAAPPTATPAHAADQAAGSGAAGGLDAGTRAALEAIRAELEAARAALDAHLRR